MDQETFKKIERLCQALQDLHKGFYMGDPKQKEVYMALHDLKQCAENKTGRKIQFKKAEEQFYDCDEEEGLMDT